MASPLEDLDELILRCRDDKAKLYIAEAVASYKAGAFRSAIVAAWIAVCFDVIEKLRELALAGDKQAEQQVQELEEIRRAADVNNALKFERDLLDLAGTKFEFFSPLEGIDLQRLQEDRNRCAHPSLVSDEMAYSPSAELARLHIHSAVTHLLQHPPVQGKYALDRLMREIESEYFPTTVKDAEVALASGPLRRPRESLVRNLSVVLVKVLLNDKPSPKRRRRIGAALKVIRKLHAPHYTRALAEKLSSMVRAVEDSKLSASIHCMRHVPEFWGFLDDDVKKRLESYVSALPAAVLDEVEFLLDYAPLSKEAHARVRRATKKELEECWFVDVPAAVIDRQIDLYVRSASFDEANAWGKHMLTSVPDFSPEQIGELLAKSAKNNQITGSYQFEALASSLREAEIISKLEFDKILREHDLESLIPEED